MERHGYLPGKDIARTFDLLRANDLVFRYVVDSWLMGEPPPAFDLLAWNADSTNLPGQRPRRVPAASAYLENALARDEYEAMGERLMLSEIGTDSYIVAGVDDHIVPWHVSYRTTQLFKGPVRFVMTSGGHIAGIVSPPGPKVRLWTNDELPRDADEWRAGAAEQPRHLVERLGDVAGRARRRAPHAHRRSAANSTRRRTTRRVDYVRS